MAFRKKAEAVLCLNPDILVVIECESLEKINIDSFSNTPTDTFWYGYNPHKGIGVFAFNGYKLQLNDWHNTDIRTFLPITVSRADEMLFMLYVVWAFNPLQSEIKYIGQVWKGVNHYKEQLTQFPSIIIGDFNSNTIWDGRKSTNNHSAMVRFLEDIDIHSTYHLHHKQIQGKEAHPTLFLYRRETRPYHIDYCFASRELIDRLSLCNVGRYSEWIGLSDHMPLTIEFKAHQ